MNLIKENERFPSISPSTFKKFRWIIVETRSNAKDFFFDKIFSVRGFWSKYYHSDLEYLIENKWHTKTSDVFDHRTKSILNKQIPRI